MKHKFLIPTSMAMLAIFAACENGDNEFPDFDYQTVYFANQYAMRTVELGTDEFVDLTPDNNHEIYIKATWSGGYSNKNNVVIDYVIDPSIVNGFYFKDSDQLVEVMPSDYYTIDDSRINIPKGQTLGGIKVHLTDKFFADEKCAHNCYVIPIRMTDVSGADRILVGEAAEENPVLTDDSHWSVQPKNFVLYGVKYANPWHGEYLRKGVDKATIAGENQNIVRYFKYVENAEVVQVNTSAFKKDILPLTVKDQDGNNVSVNLLLTFNDDNSCSVSSASENVTISGSGKFVTKGEKKSLGGKDRDAIYLNYTMYIPEHNMKFETTDTLVLRTRNVYGASAFSIERK